MRNSRTRAPAQGEPFTRLRTRPTYRNFNSRFDTQSNGHIRAIN